MNKTIWLQINAYNENDKCEIVEFEVSESWLKNNIDMPLETFLGEYTSEESQDIYDKAILENTILNEYKQ